MKFQTSALLFLAGLAAAVLAPAVLAPAMPAAAQDIPRHEYLKFVPLEPMVIQRQTLPNDSLGFYGDASGPEYVDVDPRDGIDDRRGRVFQALGERFAPVMVLNTNNLPVDHRWYTDGKKPFRLYVDRWNIAGHTPTLAETDSILCQDVGHECTDPAGTSADCRLLQLIDRYHPDRPNSLASQRYARDPRWFEVLFYDFPGESEATWKHTMQEALDDPDAPEKLLLQYVHPFVARVPDSEADAYRLTLQYWFFYPYNDGGNNHEGDWEHLNVVVGPLSRLGKSLTAAEIESIVTGAWPGDDPIVLHQVEYFFHHNVMILDFAEPDAYQDHVSWEAARNLVPEDRAGARRLVSLVRDLAFLDEAETKINTHPVVYVGADNKGTDQILSAPGGKNRDSHGSYPLPGMYKDIGPAGATEQIGTTFDLKDWYAHGGPDAPLDAERGKAVSYAKPNRIRIVPDWERILPLVESEGPALRDWAWLVLPLRWGYPAAKSPFAGVVEHAETGNLSVPGPSYNGGWNRLGAAAGFSLYEPNMLYSLFPLGWQDSFGNNLGFLNLTIPTLLAVPPLDFAWSIVSAPYRLWIKKEGPVFYPKEDIPYRFVGITAGGGYQTIPDDFGDLFANQKQFDEYIGDLLVFLALAGADSTTTITAENKSVTDKGLASMQLVFFIGDRFSSENTINHSRPKVSQTYEFSNIPPFPLTFDINLWDYEGSFRWAFNNRRVQPYGKLGYGVSWYRLENARVLGDPMIEPNSPWTVRLAGNLGAGAEWIVARSRKRGIPGGLDFSIRGEWQLIVHSLGLDETDLPLKTLVFLGFDATNLPRNHTITRNQFVLRACVTF